MSLKKDYEAELYKLVKFLEAQSYPMTYITRVVKSVSLDRLSVQNFLSIISFLGNIHTFNLNKKHGFPKPYSRPGDKLMILPAEQREILELVIFWQTEILGLAKLSKGQLTCELTKYARHRADFLSRALSFVIGQLKTPERNSRQSQRFTTLAMRLSRRSRSFESLDFSERNMNEDRTNDSGNETYIYAYDMP